MTASKAPSANGAGGAARSEGKGKKKAIRKINFRGVKLEGPPDLPGTLDFDLGDISVRAEEGHDQEALTGMHRLLESLLGRDQLLKIRQKIKGPEDPWQEELLGDTLKAYGTNSGKPSASARS